MRLYDAGSASDTAALTDANKVDGVYTVTGVNIKGSATDSEGGATVTANLSATANNNFTTMLGTTGIAPSYTGASSFSLNKK